MTKVDGSAFAAQVAVASGASAVLVGRDAIAGDLGGAALVRDDDPRRRLALMAARFFGAGSRRRWSL
ncbi:MAG: hypothetical protein R3D02_00670 [Hyphomicrobiales bacterium]